MRTIYLRSIAAAEPFGCSNQFHDPVLNSVYVVNFKCLILGTYTTVIHGRIAAEQMVLMLICNVALLSHRFEGFSTV